MLTCWVDIVTLPRTLLTAESEGGALLLAGLDVGPDLVVLNLRHLVQMTFQ